MQKMRLSTGFTLVEVVITIALIGIMAAIAAPSIGRMIKRAQAKSLARGVANHLRVARNQAMSRGEVVIVEVKAAASGGRGELRTFRSTNNAGSCRSVSTLDVDLSSPVATFNAQEIATPFQIQGLTPNSTPPLVCFQPDGRLLQLGGAPLAPNASVCDGEALVAWTAAEPLVGPLSGFDCTGRTIEEAQTNYFWRVTVWQNGQITMSDK